MQQSTLKIDPEVMSLLKEKTPKYLSLTGVANLLLEQALNNVDTVITLKTERSLSSLRETEVFNKEEEERVRALSLEGLPIPPSKDGKIIDPGLEAHTTLIRDFWKTKKGSKGDRAWSILQKGLLAIQEKYGDDVVSDQLEQGINARWNGITLKNYEEWEKKRSHRPGQSPEPEFKHPAHEVFRADDLYAKPEWKTPSEAAF